MVEDLELNSTGDATGLYVKEKGLFKGSLGSLKCAVCPRCGYVESYIESTEKLNKLIEKRKADKYK